jgi:hypothetical protein
VVTAARAAGAGPQGLAKCVGQPRHVLADKLAAIPYDARSPPTHEVVLKLNDSQRRCARALQHLGGLTFCWYPDPARRLVCVTETKTAADLDLR